MIDFCIKKQQSISFIINVNLKLLMHAIRSKFAPKIKNKVKNVRANHL